MILRVIPDVHVLLRGIFGSPSAAAGRLYTRFRQTEVRFVFSADLLAEVARALDYASLRRLNITPGMAF